MNLVDNIILNSLSASILIIIGVYSIKQDGKATLNRLYNLILILTIFTLIVDSLARLDGAPGTVLEVLNHIGNFLIFMLSPMIASLWVLFVYEYIFRLGRCKKRLIFALAAINIINFALLLFSQRYNWYYFIDENNIYHRGPLFYVSILIAMLQVFAAALIIIINKKNIEKKHFCPLLFFVVRLL